MDLKGVTLCGAFSFGLSAAERRSNEVVGDEPIRPREPPRSAELIGKHEALPLLWIGQAIGASRGPPAGKVHLAGELAAEELPP